MGATAGFPDEVRRRTAGRARATSPTLFILLTVAPARSGGGGGGAADAVDGDAESKSMMLTGTIQPGRCESSLTHASKQASKQVRTHAYPMWTRCRRAAAADARAGTGAWPAAGRSPKSHGRARRAANRSHAGAHRPPAEQWGGIGARPGRGGFRLGCARTEPARPPAPSAVCRPPRGGWRLSTHAPQTTARAARVQPAQALRRAGTGAGRGSEHTRPAGRQLPGPG